MWSFPTLHVILTPLQTLQVSLLQSCALPLSPQPQRVSACWAADGPWTCCTAITLGLTRPSGAIACERLELAGCEPLSRSRECDALPARYTIEAEHLCCIQHTETPPCFTSLAYCLQRCLTRFCFLEALSLHFSHASPVTSTMGLEAYPVTPVQRRPAGPRSMQGVVTRPVCGAMRA